jgi:hypothetical protein
METEKITGRFAEASSWAGLAAALWGAVAVAPGWLDGALGLDAVDWRAVCAFFAVLATLAAIALPERGRE